MLFLLRASSPGLHMFVLFLLALGAFTCFVG
jgi:hypothetical protein